MIFIVQKKAWLGTVTGLPDSTLHMGVGFLILLGASAVLRRPFWDWRPWLVLLAIELANETNDMLVNAAGEGTLPASLHDIWATMLLPTVLLVTAPALLRRAGVLPASGNRG